MTDLIQSQLKVIAVMVYCGLTAGLIIDVFRLFISRFFKNKKIFTVITKIFCCMAIAFFIGDFSFFCQNGKLTLTSGIAFAAGLWLWRKFFYDIITSKKDRAADSLPPSEKDRQISVSAKRKRNL